MKKTIQPIDFVTKDYEGFRQMMLDLAPIIAPEWTDHSESDMGVVLVDLLAYGLDLLSYYQDKAVNENFISTAKTRRAVINMCRLLGYELHSQYPARFKIVFSKGDGFIEDEIRILKGTKVGTDPAMGEPVIFELESSLVIPSGVVGNERLLHVVTEPTTSLSFNVTDSSIFTVGKGISVLRGDTVIYSDIAVTEILALVVTVESSMTLEVGDLIFGSKADYGDLGSRILSVIATHGVTIPEDIIGVGNSLPFQRFTLTYPDAIRDTIEMRTNEEGLLRSWTRVDDFLSSTSSDRHYRVIYDEFNKAVVEFGNGISGRVVPTQAVIRPMYRVGGGEIGNVGINTINSFINTEVVGITSIANPELPIERGLDPEDLDHARINAPRVYRTNSRAVTSADFENISTTFVGVAKAKCIETFNAQGDLYVYIAPVGYQTPTQLLKDELLAHLNTVKLVHDNPIIMDALYVDYIIEAVLTIDNNYIALHVKNEVEVLINELLNVDYFDFGESIIKSQIVKEIMSVDGIVNLSLTIPVGDLEIPENSIARLSGITLTTVGGVAEA